MFERLSYKLAKIYIAMLIDGMEFIHQKLVAHK